jgi:N-acetylglutamate synthase
MLNMLHHLSIGTTHTERAARFYDGVLMPLGYERVWSDLRPGEDDQAVGYGSPGSGDQLAIKQTPEDVPQVPGFHLAFAATTPEAVIAFHAAALSHGGVCNGPPGLRPDYGAAYFSAFVVDPDGYRLEAVCKGCAKADMTRLGLG